MKELNLNELKMVSGAIGLPGAGVGALSGAAGYLGGAAVSGNFSFNQLAFYTGAGAIGQNMD